MTEIDLLSTVLHLRVADAEQIKERALPRWWGRAGHELLLRVIQKAAPRLSEQLHEPNALRPFTASNLMGRKPDGKLDIGTTYRLRLTALRADVAGILQGEIADGLLSVGSEIGLDYIRFQVVQPPEGSDAAAWQSAASYQALSSEHLLAGKAPQRRVDLIFTSPTMFKSGGVFQPLPLPEMVFGSLLNRWNDFAPLALPKELRRYAGKCLMTSRFQIRSQTVTLQENALRVGAVGKVSYMTNNYDRYWMSLVHALAAYSLYAGVGAGTSMGLGQCRCVPFTNPK